LYSISGKQTLTGQHCNPLVGSTRLEGVHKLTGYFPAVFGQDFGFSAPGTWDGINFRQQIVDEAIRRHRDGHIITLMWHAVRPTEDEPVVFEESIQGKLSEEEWLGLFEAGSQVHERWKSQVDVIAFFLKQLREAGVPVLWRPYHEMNGGWFWWGRKTDYKKLYRMLFDRLVNFHKLNNLLWVFNANEIRLGVDSYDRYYPGDDVVDILATDVYSNKFSNKDYKSLLALAGNKPIALGEVGNIPTPRLLRRQPRWTWFMYWHDPSLLWKERKEVTAAYQSRETIRWDELPWVKPPIR
jgi:mannan endo-1,4-beta-mannosidase